MIKKALNDVTTYLLIQSEWEETFVDYDICADEWRFNMAVDGGELQYNPFENKLYIWSGMGLGSNRSSSDVNEDEDNSYYGYSVSIKSLAHFKTILKVLV